MNCKIVIIIIIGLISCCNRASEPITTKSSSSLSSFISSFSESTVKVDLEANINNIVGWKTYKYSNKFSFSYPPDITIEERQDVDYFSISGYNYDPNNAGSSFDSGQYKIEISIAAKGSLQVRCSKDMFFNEPTPIALKEIMVSNLPGYLWSNGNNYLMCFNGHDYIVVAGIGGNLAVEEQMKFMDSFKANP